MKKVKDSAWAGEKTEIEPGTLAVNKCTMAMLTLPTVVVLGDYDHAKHVSVPD